MPRRDKCRSRWRPSAWYGTRWSSCLVVPASIRQHLSGPAQLAAHVDDGAVRAGRRWTIYALVRQVLLTTGTGTTLLEVVRASALSRTQLRSVPLANRPAARPLVPGAARVRRTGHLSARNRHADRHRDRLPRNGVQRAEVRHPAGRGVRDALSRSPCPARAMHSFSAPHNAVSWMLVVRGRMARWPEFERRFPLYVYPLSTAQPSIRPQSATRRAGRRPHDRRPVRLAQARLRGGQYRPGQRLSGHFLAERAVPWPVRSAELSILWYTAGQGDEDFADPSLRAVRRRARPAARSAAAATVCRYLAAEPVELRRPDRQGLLVRPAASLSSAGTGSRRGKWRFAWATCPARR